MHIQGLRIHRSLHLARTLPRGALRAALLLLIATTAVSLPGRAMAARAGAAYNAVPARPEANQDKGASEAHTTAELGSPFSIGTLFGLSVPLFTPDTYVVRSGVVVKDHSASGWDYVLPSVFVVPSVALASKTVGNKVLTFGAILPAGLTSKGPNGQDVSVGAGFCLGWSKAPTGNGSAGSAEVGVAIALIWSPFQSLTDAQKQSLNTAMPLPQGESDTVGTKLMPALTVGIYLMPSL